MPTYNILKHSDLTKRGGHRIDVFLSKVKTGDTFITTQGEATVDKKHLSALQEGMRNSGFKTTLNGKLKNRPITLKYPTDFYKTGEFGGKGQGSGTAAEDRFLGLFREELSEKMAKEKKPFIKIKVNGRIVQVADCVQPKGTPKSDFNLVDMDGKAVGFLSHKAGRGPKDFQQYGGLSHNVFTRVPAVKKFMQDAVTMFPNGLERGQSCYRPTNDKMLVTKSIFGVDAGGGQPPGLNNVDEFHQGEMKLVKQGNSYIITSLHKGLNGDIPTKNSGYECMIYARFTSDRGANIAGVFLENARVGVFPVAQAPSTCIRI